MIRIRLIKEGRVVKQITSRVHEGVVLEQIKNYKDPFDTIQIVEGELSEGAKEMLHHVARKIIPAAMAAGVAMSGAGNVQAQGGANPNYPGLNHSIGQHMSDIFSPNYKEAMRQREYQRSTERQVWNAEQDEIRKQRVNDARARVRPAPGQQHVVYDQSRISQDGKSYIIYGMDNKVRRIPVTGTEYMPGDSQRLPHYITSAGSVFYVRHPHMNESVSEGYTVTRGIDKERYQERPGLEGPFSTKSGKVVYYDKKEGKYYDPDTDFYIGHDDWIALNEGWKEKLAAAALAGSMALGAAGAHARVTPGEQDPGINRLTGKPVATQVAPTDQTPAAQAPKGFSKEYLQKAADPNRTGRYLISVEKAQELLNQMGESVDEAAPALVRGAAGLAAGGIAAAGTVPLMAILGPILGIGVGAAGAYNATKYAMAGADKIWDWATKKLGGGDEDTKAFATAHLDAALKGASTFVHQGQSYNVKMSQSQAQKEAPALRQAIAGLSERRLSGVAEDATVGTIPASGTVGTAGRTQFAPTGKTTNAKFNKNGQIELDTEQEDDGSVNLDANAVKQLQQAGVQIKEDQDSPVASAIARRIMSQRLDLLQKYGPQKVMDAIDEVADFVGDVEEIGSSDVSAWVKHAEQLLGNMGESVTEGTDTLAGILSKFSADYAKFKAGGDIDENQDFFDALYEYYFDEMPYGVKKARDGDPYEWITDRLDQESGISPVAEAEDEDEATPGDQAAADQNIIMQIRKASDYERPTKIKLADGSENVIAPNIAKQILAKFDKMKTDSKALLQDTLNTNEGFKEILNYFGGGVREQAAARAGKIMSQAMQEAGLADVRARMDARRDPPEKQSPNPTTPLPPVPPYVAPAELKAGDIIGYRPKNAKMMPIRAKVLKLMSGDMAMVSVSSPSMIARNNGSPVITIGPLATLDIQNPFNGVPPKTTTPGNNNMVMKEAAEDWLPAYNALVKNNGTPSYSDPRRADLNWKKSMSLAAKEIGLTGGQDLLDFVVDHTKSVNGSYSSEKDQAQRKLTNEISRLIAQAPTMDDMRNVIKQQAAGVHQQNLTNIQNQLDLENAPLQHEMSVQALINKAELDQADQKELLELDMEARLAIIKIKQDLELDAKERLTQIEREIEDRKEREDIRKHELELAQAGYKHEISVINATAEGEYRKAKLEADYQIHIKQLDNIDNAGERQNRLDQINTEKAKQLAVIDAETKARVEVLQKEVDVERQQSDIKIEQAFMMTLMPIWGAALTAAHAAGATWKAGINKLNKALAMLSKPVMPTAQKESRYDRRDAYQRDYDSSVNMDRGADHRGLNQELAHEDNDQYRVVIARNGKWEETKAQPKGPGMNAAMALINSLHAKFPSMHLGMMWPNGKVDNYGKKA
jgi:hypothetical protein